MIKVTEIQDLENFPELQRIVLEEVIADGGFFADSGKRKVCSVVATKGKHKYAVDKEYKDASIVMETFETPQYEGHEPCGKKGLYYTTKVVAS